MPPPDVIDHPAEAQRERNRRGHLYLAHLTVKDLMSRREAPPVEAWRDAVTGTLRWRLEPLFGKTSDDPATDYALSAIARLEPEVQWAFWLRLGLGLRRLVEMFGMEGSVAIVRLFNVGLEIGSAAAGVAEAGEAEDRELREFGDPHYDAYEGEDPPSDLDPFGELGAAGYSDAHLD